MASHSPSGSQACFVRKAWYSGQVIDRIGIGHSKVYGTNGSNHITIYMHAYVYISMYNYIYIYLFTQIYIYIYTYIYIYNYAERM